MIHRKEISRFSIIGNHQMENGDRQTTRKILINIGRPNNRLYKVRRIPEARERER